ncbi:DUF4383 domain-containing protein [Ktedonobacter racemifer]|uniref:DUF4383 domain-containing protein n=1 Tax=Ktedonobacter racemifer DSM 44963 TaxID=485913 RepID=D6TSV1_KTERA|nr:DUF4383 domain-containing protein [Ktedonobacter racemifer]EFH83502.1 conserved hypothetical protein [Ktedonobacter racemifer DSM 44963]
MRHQTIQRLYWTSNRFVTLIIGIAFILIGAIGFFYTPDRAMGNMMGFDIDFVHNCVHLLTGIVALAVFFTGWPRLFNRIFGFIYLLMGLAGIIYPGLYVHDLFLGAIHANAADHILHVVVGAIVTFMGYFVYDY